jgi:catechol 2,3-dioxygenase-like lactoylglutathione lyase family enzyme
MRVSGIRVFVRDIERARAFFGSVLDLPLTVDGRAQGWCVFNGGEGLDLVVEAVPADAPADEQALVGRFSGISFKVDDMAAEYRRLLAAGVRFSGEPETQAWGGVLATFGDIEGNQFQLVQMPAAR